MELKSNTPRHEQISNWLKQQITTGGYGKDDKLPSEQELSERFEVSRVTVRRALQTLESERIIYRCQGLGSFVKKTGQPQHMIRLTDFMEDMKAAGKEAQSEVIELKQEPSNATVATNLGIKEGQMVLRLDRLRLGDGEPIAFDITWFPIFYGQLIIDQELTDKTIFRILEEDYQIPIIRGKYLISACVANELTAPLLQIAEGAPLLVFDRISLTVNDKAVYFQRRFYRPDKISWQVSLERNIDNSNPNDVPLKEFMPVFS
jgi:GntR family transcriptional regulator